jgi:hypothetical protein
MGKKKKKGEKKRKMSAKYKKKREKIVGRGEKSFKFKPIYLVLVVFILAVVGVYFYTQNSGRGRITTETAMVVEKPDYSGKTIKMSEISSKIENGEIKIPLAELKEKSIVWFDYNVKKWVPLMAYIAPSGKVVTAVRMCEPCYRQGVTQTFHIKGNELVCDTCDTTWLLENLKATTQWGCPDHPPQTLANKISGDYVTIKESDVLSWKMRKV